MDQLFTEVPIPAHHRRKTVAHQARWYSWSPASIRLIEMNLERILALPAPSWISVRGCEPYSATYTYRLSALSPALACFALKTAEALLRVPVKRLRFFSGMLDPPLSTPVMHKCFALMRAGVTRLAGDPKTALHVPAQSERLDDGFPLHCDLFLTDRLLLVFDDVAKGNSGQAQFLPLRYLEVTIKSNHLIPLITKRRLRALLNRKTARDCFDKCFDLLHSNKHPWAASLARTMKQNCLTIKLRPGEGYLLNDRHWLHGRTAVRGPVSERRFHRLIYGQVAGRDEADSKKKPKVKKKVWHPTTLS
jgi:hypothetical protein